MGVAALAILFWTQGSVTLLIVPVFDFGISDLCHFVVRPVSLLVAAAASAGALETALPVVADRLRDLCRDSGGAVG